MSRICRNMGDLGKLRFYELYHESNMRLLKTHSHTSNGLVMEPELRDSVPSACERPRSPRSWGGFGKSARLRTGGWRGWNITMLAGRVCAVVVTAVAVCLSMVLWVPS